HRRRHRRPVRRERRNPRVVLVGARAARPRGRGLSHRTEAHGSKAPMEGGLGRREDAKSNDGKLAAVPACAARLAGEMRKASALVAVMLGDASIGSAPSSFADAGTDTEQLSFVRRAPASMLNAMFPSHVDPGPTTTPPWVPHPS